MSIFNRVNENLQERRNRVLSGKVNCIPWGLPRFENNFPGIEQGKYYLITANAKVGKTQITDYLFVYNALNQIIEKKLNVRLKIFYFTLEMSKEEKMLYLISNILYIKEGLRIPPVDLKSTSSQRILSQEVLDIIKKYREYIEKIESIIEFVDSVSNPTGIFKIVRDYAHAHGTQHRRVIKTGDGREIEVDDYYEPNDPDEYVMVIIDHISLISTESNLDLRESITKLSSSYLIQLRNKYNYIPVIIQQQAAAQESVENKKANKLKPSLDGLGDNKLTQRDANVILGLFSPLRHELPEYMGYDITFFRDKKK